MKPIYFFISLLCLSQICKAQDNCLKTIDSMAIVSRIRADKVFDTIKAPKMLFSTRNEYFYIIIKDISGYKEYFVSLNSLGEIKNKFTVKNRPKTKKQRKRHKQYQQILSLAEPIFDLRKYHQGLITHIPEAAYTAGVFSYFVVKDTTGTRYGEYFLPVITSPLLIDSNLWIYLIRRSSDEMYKHDNN